MPFYAIAAMSENRVIGNHGKIPWHLPEDFRWFKHKTMGGTLIMGRKTFESIGKPLPGRDTVVLTRKPQEQLSETAFIPHQSFVSYVHKNPDIDYWICGGAQIYEQLLNGCAALYLTRVKGTAEGDVKMPLFEDKFKLHQVLHETDKFQVELWRNNNYKILFQEKWPDFSKQITASSPGPPRATKVIYCLYHSQDWKML